MVQIKIINVIIALLLLSTIALASSEVSYQSGQWVAYKYCNYDGDCAESNHEICIVEDTDSVILSNFNFVETKVEVAKENKYWGQCGILGYKVGEVDDTFYIAKSYPYYRKEYIPDEIIETVCPVCVPKIINNTIYRNVSVNNTLYKETYSFSPSLQTMILSSSGVFVLSIILSILFYIIFIRGVKNEFEKCPNCNKFTVRKMPFRNKFYCPSCHRKTYKKRIMDKDNKKIQKEAAKDVREKYIPAEYR